MAALERNGRRRRGRAWWSAALGGAALSAGCLPREDLASYADGPSERAAAAQPPPALAPLDDLASPKGQSPPESGLESPLPLALGESASGDANAANGVVRDAGADAAALAAPEPDAGALERGSAGEACARIDGTLEPGSTVCLVFFASARVTWQAAERECQRRDSSLVSIQTQARNDLLTTLIGTTDIWTGARDPGTNSSNNAFVWRDLVPVDPSVATWAPGEPDAVPNQFCVIKTGEPASVTPPGPAAPWRDRPCSDLQAYVCERTF